MLILASCGGDDSASQTPAPTATAPAQIGEVAPNRPVTVGLSIALSGDQQTIGEDLAIAAELAVEDFGAELKGHSIEIVQRDDACTDPEKSTDAAGIFIVDESLIGVVGPMCTVGAQAANPIYEGVGVIHISPTATRDELSAQGERFFFRTAWRDEVQAQVQARYAFETLGAKSASIVDDAEPYGVGLAEAFGASYEELGGRVVAHDRIERGTTDFESLARQTVETAPAIVVFQGLNPEGALFVKALRDAGYGGVFMGPDGLLSLQDFIPVAGTAAEGAILTGGSVADQPFVDRFIEKAQRPPSTPFVLQAYDAVTALLRAADSVAEPQSDGALTIDRQLLAETLRTQRFAGLSGSLTFDERGDRRGETALELGIRIYRIENSGLVLVE
jgi:branched-chain amino acid transport system substrate-binding protein